MKIARFRTDAGATVGVVDGDDLVQVDVDDAVALLAAEAALRNTLVDDALASGRRTPIEGAELLAPVPHPSKFLAIGLNYADHLAETGREAPEFPVFFNKQTTCVSGPGEGIEVPRVSGEVDFEGELGIVIGRRCRDVAAADAPSVVGGFMVVNDVSVRDWQRRSPTMTLGKSFDTHGPTGPWITTGDEAGDPHGRRIRTWVNDELMQDGDTGQMLVDCWRQIEILSTVCTLEPGDIIATGTPAGVGMARTPPVWLAAGDVVRIEIEGLGVLENPVVPQP